MKKPRTQLRSTACALALLSLTLPVGASEVLFKGTGVSLPAAFLCGGSTMPAGRYDVEAAYDPKPDEKSVLRVSRENKTLCEVTGSPTNTYGDFPTSKVRIFTKTNTERQAIEIDVVVPPAIRSRVPNQVYYLPVAAKN